MLSYMEHKYHFSTLTPLTIEECVLTNGGEEGDFWHDIAKGVGRVFGYIDGVLDKIAEDVQDFFDGVQEGWESTRN